jgi:hypothetical protein
VSGLRSAACYICGSKYRKVRLALGAGPALCDSDWHLGPDAESTSARLRRVEQERDEALAKLNRITHLFAEAEFGTDVGAPDLIAALEELPIQVRPERPTPHLDAVKAERDEAKQALAEALDRVDAAESECAEALAKLAKPCGECHPCEQYAPLQDAQKIADTNDLLRAELASARTELDAVRTARDTLERTEDAVRVVTVTPLAPVPPISVLQRWLCMLCGAQFAVSQDHSHGALVPVVITTTYKDLHDPGEGLQT